MNPLPPNAAPHSQARSRLSGLRSGESKNRHFFNRRSIDLNRRPVAPAIIGADGYPQGKTERRMLLAFAILMLSVPLLMLIRDIAQGVTK